MRNVVLVCLDTVRKDYYDEYATRIRDLADVSVSQCRAASNWSAPSHASMFTGRLPHRHGVHAGAPSFAPMDDPTFLDDLDGYRTLGVSANPYASSAYGFDAYFDEFVDVDDYSRYPEGLDVRQFAGDDGDRSYLGFLRAAMEHDHTVRSLANGVCAGLTKASEPAPIPRLFDHGAAVVRRETVRRVGQGDEPFFGFVNFMDAHTPLQHVRGFDADMVDAPADWICSTDRYNPWDVLENIDAHGTYLQYRRNLYAAAIEYLDRQVAGFVEAVQAASDRETTFVVTADHGENLGFPEDRRLVMHKGSLTEGLLHVPFDVINPPEPFDPTDEANPYVSHLALPEIVTSLAAGEALPADVASSTVPAEVVGLNGLTDADAIDDYEFWNRMIRAAYDGREKVVWDSLGDADRYRIDFDEPSVAERVARDVDVPDWARALFDVDVESYKQGFDASAANEDVGDATRQRLQDLGYV